MKDNEIFSFYENIQGWWVYVYPRNKTLGPFATRVEAVNAGEKELEKKE
jgi:hypothetical protein